MKLDMQRIIDGVHEYLEKQFKPIADRLKALEARQLEPGEPGEPGARGPAGKDGAPGERGEPGNQGERGAQGSDGERGPIGLTGEPGVDGKDGAPGEPGERGPAGKDGEPGSPGEPGEQGERGETGSPGPAGKDGKSVTEADIAAAIETAVEKRISTWALDFERRAADVLQHAIDKIEIPKDGAPGEPGERGERGDPGEPGDRGADGVDGKDGEPGEPGERGDTGSPGAKGKDGVDGKDGFGFDDIDVVQVSEKQLQVVFQQADRKKEFSVELPIVVDCGVFKYGRTYTKGDGVTWGGSFWIAQKNNSGEKPGSGDGWRLAVKKGKDGRGA